MKGRASALEFRIVVGLLISFLCANVKTAAQFSDINHIIHMGQSLGGGEESLPLVTDSATAYGNFSFKLGTHTWSQEYFANQPELRDSSYFTFIPLKAHIRGNEAETIANGLCDHLKETSKQLLNKNFNFLFSYSGQGGRLLRELDKQHDEARDPRAADRQSPGGYYSTSIDNVRRGKRHAASLGLTYSVSAITWMQGESNASGQVTRWEAPIADPAQYMKIYTDDLIRLKDDFQHDIAAITGQQNPVPFFTYQTAGATIGTAQLNACDKAPGMYLVGPTYMMPNAANSRLDGIHGHSIHLTADAERWLGEMFGKVIRRTVVEKIEWEPLRPLNAKLSRNRKRVRVTFKVPQPPLVLDSIFLPKQGNGFGFELYSNTTDFEIKNVKLINGNSVDIELVKRPDRGIQMKLKYGLNSFVKNVSSPILTVSEQDTLINSVPCVRIVFKGDITQEFYPAASEGVFKLFNRETDDLTSILVRKVSRNTDGNTVLIGERNDLRNGVNFKQGQHCLIARCYNYGNVRDSDPEQAIFSFRDESYGDRAGQKYPLYNWLVVFQDLNVE